MTYRKRVVWGCIGMLLVYLTSVAYGDDMGDVKAAFDASMKLFNAHQATAFSDNAHDDVVLFGILSPFAVRGKAAVKAMLRDYFADHDRTTMTAVNPEFRIIGLSALAWGHFTSIEDPEVGPRVTVHGRYTFTYAKREGHWLLVSLHFSPLGIED